MARLIVFLRNVNLELKRVTWPTKDEITSATVVVIIATLVVSVYLRLLDLLYPKILHFVLK